MKTGEKIRYYRELNNLTQEDVAVKLNTTPQNIYKYEKGIIKNIPTTNIVALAALFNVSPSTLLGWDDNTIDIIQNEGVFEATPEKILFGKKLRLKRQEAGFTVKSFALKLHLVPFIIENYENGIYDSIEPSRLEKIANLTGTPVEFFTDDSITVGDEPILTETEKILISEYREHPEHRSEIHRLLGIAGGDVHLYAPMSLPDFDAPKTRLRVAQRPLSPYKTGSEKENTDE
ncbi:MAG: helix-turn-helix transcriptional regulator [Oscillospiraceae bacterium]|nr:helix-turn-helix transcriptional regulator [Oscillospiraceae bacterium]